MVRATRRIYDAFWSLSRHDGFEIAGYIAYTLILAIFPFLIFLVALAGYLGSVQMAEALIARLFALLPGDVAGTLAPVVRDVLTRQQGGLLTLSGVGALWTASSGVEALRTALNRAYGGVDARPFWLLRVQSVVMILVTALALIVLSLLAIVGPLALQWLEAFLALPPAWWVWVGAASYGISLLLMVLTVLLLHRFLPCHHPSLRASLPGSVLSAVLWLIGAALFSLYLAYFAHYDVTYGSLGGVMITLLFFYLTAVIFMFGAEYNALMLAEVAEARPPPAAEPAPHRAAEPARKPAQCPEIAGGS